METCMETNECRLESNVGYTRGIAMESWIVAYAKISIEKGLGVTLQGVYFGGIGRSQIEAEQIARDCVNSIKGGTILPKIVSVNKRHAIIDALYDAADRFEMTTKRMQDAEAVLNKGKK